MYSANKYPNPPQRDCYGLFISSPWKVTLTAATAANSDDGGKKEMGWWMYEVAWPWLRIASDYKDSHRNRFKFKTNSKCHYQRNRSEFICKDISILQEPLTTDARLNLLTITQSIN